MQSATSSGRLDPRPGLIARDRRHFWRDAFLGVRAETERRAAPLVGRRPGRAVDAGRQPDQVAPRARRHGSSSSSCCVPHAPGYRIFDERFPFLFNSYYVAAGPRHARPQRGLITRPNAREVAAYRAHVDAAVARLIDERRRDDARRVCAILEIGLHHEQQHQELLLTDILHAFAQNPTDPAYDADWQPPRATRRRAVTPICPTGIHRDRARRRRLLLRQRGARASRADCSRVRIATALGHQRRVARIHRRWRLRDAVAVAVRRLDARCRREGWQAPGYWRKSDGAWHAMTLGGLRPVDPAAPVMHVSYYEADAFARWRGQAPADRGGVGGRGARGPDRRRLRHRLAMDAQRLSRPIPGYRAADRRARRIQRQVHGQPDGAARLFAGDARRPCARQLPQLLLSAGALAIQRPAAGRVSE